MSVIKKIEYTLKAAVGGAGVGLALCGLLTFIPIVPISLAVAGWVAVVAAIALSGYTILNT